MLKKTGIALFVTSSALLLASCSSIGEDIGEHMANSSMMRSLRAHTIKPATLANGTKIQVGELSPAPNWNCKMLATKEVNWDRLDQADQHSFNPLNRTESHVEAAKMAEFKTIAIKYANDNKLKINYIYLFQALKSTTSVTASSGSGDTGLLDNNSDTLYSHTKTLKPAMAYFYNCQAVNPKS